MLTVRQDLRLAHGLLGAACVVFALLSVVVSPAFLFAALAVPVLWLLVSSILRCPGCGRRLVGQGSWVSPPHRCACGQRLG